ncbi:major capsid protein [Dehalogenimonas etheniformans]|uniref:Phage major capsid protein n=1 Tax=Dehalogenimonas etheniformans TaxID=1536648 RepID=A0A2P5P6U5_9CHLR|nr:phage major capsid protein [Dehalogenimonas etheniformans]PPD58018.1 phage major capsid protein [Dehalogenimonas etheniformans]QNT75368.1 phage major capsid protein [Dehalogenimonas etheniformans]
MAITLTEAAKLSNDLLKQGVIETIIKDSPVLRRLPFIEITGNGLTYNQEKTLPDIAFYDVGDTWTESTPTFEQKTATLKIMGGDADVDNFLKTTRSNVQDLQTAIIQQKAKALKDKFEQTFIYGDESGNAKEFDGLRKLIDTTTAGAQVIAMGAAGATLTLDKLDELIDAVKGGKPDLLIMSRRTRRKLNSLLRASGALLETDRDAFGNSVQYWNGVAIGVDDWMLDTHVVASSVETATTGGLCSTIYAVQLGEGALAGLSAPGMVQVENVGALEDKDASRTRVKWYASLALFSSVKAAALIGVKD